MAPTDSLESSTKAAISVMIVDGSSNDANPVSHLIEQSGENYLVTHAIDVQSAIELLHQQPADCLIVDYSVFTEQSTALSHHLMDAQHSSTALLVMISENPSLEIHMADGLNPSFLIKEHLSAFGANLAVQQAIYQTSQRCQLAMLREEQAKFMRILTHDLRAPFRHLKQSAQILAEDIAQNKFSSLGEIMAVQSKAISQGDSLISAVQTYASLEQRVNYKRVSLADLLDELVFLHWRDQRERIAVKGSLPAVHGHQGQLQSLFLNVINNALLYNESKYPEVSVYTIELTSSSAIICIEDNGTGMDDQYVQSIFEPFSWLQSRDKYPGVGLGLAICQRIVNHHGGKLWCETELGQGSRFYIQLPIALHPAA